MGSEIKAKLGVDTESVPGDLAKAKGHFDKFGNEVAHEGSKHGENFGDHFAGAIGNKLGAHHLGTAVAAALGINYEKIAEGIAGAIAGGSKEGWEEAGKIADENAALIKKKITDALTPDQLATHIKKELDKAVEELQNYKPKQSLLQKLGIGSGELNADQLKEQGELQKVVLENEEKLRELKKKAAEEDKKYLEEVHQLNTENVDDYAKIVNAKVRQSEIEKELLKTNLSIEERHKLEIDQLKQANIIREAGKKIEEEEEKLLKEESDFREQEAKKEEERIKKLSALRLTSAEQEKKVREDTAKISDRSKLTIAELSQITNAPAKNPYAVSLDLSYGKDADLTSEQRAAKKAAQEAQDQADRVEELRKAGRTSEAEDALKKLDEMRGNLVNSGFVKSTEDPAKALVEQLHIDTEKLNKTLGEIRDVTKGHFINE